MVQDGGDIAPIFILFGVEVDKIKSSIWQSNIVQHALGRCRVWRASCRRCSERPKDVCGVSLHQFDEGFPRRSDEEAASGCCGSRVFFYGDEARRRICRVLLVDSEAFS